jgi:hypothetical protein
MLYSHIGSILFSTNIYCLFYFILCRSICLSLSISNSFPVYVHAVFHFVPPLEIHNLHFGKHDKGDKFSRLSYNDANENFCGTCKAAPSGNFLRLSPPDCVVLESLVITVKSWVCFQCVKTRGSVCLHFSANEKADTILY